MAAATDTNTTPKRIRPLSSLLDIRPADRLPLVILLGHSFLKGMSRIFFEAPVNSLFLNRFSIGMMPAVYIATALVSTMIGLGYAKLEEKSGARTLLASTLIFLAATTGLLYLALLITNSPAIVFGAMIWKDVNWTLMSVEFWALAGLLLDVRQGKRLFGLITAGEIVAGTASGFSVPLIVKLGGTLSLLLVSFAAVSLNVLFLIYTFRVFRDRSPGFQEKVKDSDREEPEDSQPLLSMVKDRYLAMFFGISVLSFLVEYFLEYVFYGRVETAFPSEARLASFFGLYYGLLGLAQLMTSASAGALLTRYGMGAGLLLLPLVNLMTTGLAAAAGGLGGIAALVFITAAAAKFLDEAIRHTVQMPVYSLLYRPLPESRRLRAQAVRESIVEPIAIGLCGAFLFAFRSILHMSATAVLCVTFGVCAAWAVLSFLVRREYTVRLTQAFIARRLGEGSLSLQDPAVTQVLRNGLRSPRAGQVIYSMTMLDEAGQKLTHTELTGLLSHSEPAVRRHVIADIESQPSGNILAAVIDRLAVESDASIRGDVLRTMCALGGDEAAARAIPYLDAAPEVREGALTGLLRYGGIKGRQSGEVHLNAMLGSPNPAERRLGAQVLGEAGISGYAPQLLLLLADGDDTVRRAAIHCVRKLKCAPALPHLVEALSVPAIRADAFEALTYFGAAVLPLIESSLGDPGKSRALRVALARLAGKIEGGADVLKNHVRDPDGTVRIQVFASLVSCSEALHLLDAASVRSLVEREVEDATWLLAVLEDIPEQPAIAPLRRALHHEVDECRNRIFLLLSLLHPRRVIERARMNLRSGTAAGRSNAIEVLDNIVSREIRLTLLPLLDDVSDSDRLRQLAPRFPQQSAEASERIRELIVQPAGRLLAWTRACAIFSAGHDPDEGWQAVFQSAALDTDPIVSETAVWALSRIKSSGEGVAIVPYS